MTNISFETLVQAAHELTPAQKMALIFTLQREMTQDIELTREQALAELEALRAAGAFDSVDSLYGKYANPVQNPLTIDDLGWMPDQAAAIRAQLSAFAEDWDDPAMDVYGEF